jgi:Fe-S-cluster containining protein
MPVDREKLRLNLIEYTCGQKCMGLAGHNGGCCTLGDRDWIIGPINDVDAFLARLSEKLGRPVLRGEAFIDYEEGRALFPERSTWQGEANYPTMRVRTDDPGYPCVYFDRATGGCTVHAIRPEVCRTWLCDHLQQIVSVL